eukprot:1374130-Amorphochlora_amoeboformis.AAC.1
MPRREAWNSPSPTPGMFGGSSLRHQPTAENAPPRMKTKIKKVIVEQKKNVWRGRMEQQKAKARWVLKCEITVQGEDVGSAVTRCSFSESTGSSGIACGSRRGSTGVI